MEIINQIISDEVKQNNLNRSSFLNSG